MKVAQPLLPPLLTESNDIISLFTHEDTISSIRIENCIITSVMLHKTSLAECVIVKTELSGLSVPKFDVIDCEFKGCDFTASKFPESGWRRVMIDSARCSGTQLNDSLLKDITFKNSKLEIVNFRFANMENISFESCVMNDVDFYNARLKNVEFVDCTINNITFANAKMLNVDLSKSFVEGIKGLGSLRGATISFDQLMQLAPSFAAESGIKIK